MILDFKKLRPSANHPPYPPYHTGPYLEEYFYSFYLKNKNKFDLTSYTLIPIFWTNILHIPTFSKTEIQFFIDALPKNKKYFTVSQLDDGIEQLLPPSTVNFVAGGNMDGICIPLICSPIPQEHIHICKKDIFCSFIGTYVNNKNYNCRIKLYNEYHTDPDFYFTPPRHWERVVQQQNFLEFINITLRSRFTLCPRGYGLSSFRLYETLQLNSVPVYVYDKKFIPFEDILNWEEFCVLIPEHKIPLLKDILKDISTEQYNSMLLKGKEVYKNYFTLEKTSEQILNVLNKIK